MSEESNDTGQPVSNTEESNSYLMLREAKIRRNRDQLEKLGLASPPPSNQITSSAKLPKNRKSNSDSEWKPPVRTRRSSRLSEAASDGAQEKSETQDADPSKPIQKRQRTDGTEQIEKPLTVGSKSRDIVQSEAKPGTTRATYVDVQQVLYGHFDYPVFIGRRLAATGKAAVIEHANFMCGNGRGVSFNKYSGVCEFQNDVLFLWVNQNSPDAELRNEFLNGGKQLTWWGGSRMRAESPAIQKLVSVGRKATKKDLPDSCGIVLWYRMYDSAKRTFEPYTCLGRLGYSTHEIGSHPIKFVWDLMDYDVLKNASEPNGNCVFDEILKRNM